MTATRTRRQKRLDERVYPALALWSAYRRDQESAGPQGYPTQTVEHAIARGASIRGQGLKLQDAPQDALNVDEWVASLTLDEQAIMERKYLSGWSDERAGKWLGCARTTFQSRLSSLLDQLDGYLLARHIQAFQDAVTGAVRSVETQGVEFLDEIDEEKRH